jgi:hypothetical protein
MWCQICNVKCQMFLSNVKFGMPTVIDVMPSVKYLMSNVFAESQI